MIQKVYIFILLSFFNIVTFAQSEVLTLYKKDGTTVQYLFIDNPKIYHQGEYLLMKTDEIEVVYPFKEVSKYTVNESRSIINLKEIVIDNDEISEYINETDIDDCNIVYARTFADTLWQSFYVPFEVKLSDFSDDFEFALINNFHQYDDNNDGYFDRVELEIKHCDPTKVLQANYPYLIRSKTIGKKQIKIENTLLYKTEEYSIDCSSIEFTYTFTGNYNRITDLRRKGVYYLNGGYLTKAYTSSEEVEPFRWTMSITARNSQYKDSPIIVDSKKIKLRIYGNNNSTDIENVTPVQFTEKYYDLNGNECTPDKKGVYIMKMRDGSCRKVYIKNPL